MTRTLAEIASEIREIADDLDRPIVADALRNCAAGIEHIINPNPAPALFSIEYDADGKERARHYITPARAGFE